MASEEKKGPTEEFVVTIAGRINDAEYQKARVLGRRLAASNSRVGVECIPLTEAEWEVYVRTTGKTLGEAGGKHRVSPLIFCNGSEYIGRTPQFVVWMRQTFDVKADAGNMVFHTRAANKAYREYIDGHRHPHCFLDIAVGDARPQRVVFELFSSICPRTAENFRALCAGDRGSSESGVKLSYEGSPIHRVVRGGWVQGGDIAGGHGDGGESIYGATFSDESFAVKHSAAGILSMASTGHAHTNSSQWFVTLGPVPSFDRKFVAFGKVVSGMRTLRCIENLPSLNQRPQPEVVVKLCGVFTGAVYGSTPGSEDARNAEERAAARRARREAADAKRKAAADEAKRAAEAEAAEKAAAEAEARESKAEEGKPWAAVNLPEFMTTWLSGTPISDEQHLKLGDDSPPPLSAGAASAEMADWMNRDFAWAFNGEWEGHGDSEGWKYSMLYRVRPVRPRATGWPDVPAGVDFFVDGFIRWTLLAHPADQPEYAKRVGKSALEIVSGTAVDGKEEEPLKINLRGYRYVDPGEETHGTALITVGQYRIEVTGSGADAVMKGVSRGFDNGWNNELTAVAAPDA